MPVPDKVALLTEQWSKAEAVERNLLAVCTAYSLLSYRALEGSDFRTNIAGVTKEITRRWSVHDPLSAEFNGHQSKYH